MFHTQKGATFRIDTLVFYVHFDVYVCVEVNMVFQSVLVYGGVREHTHTRVYTHKCCS